MDYLQNIFNLSKEGITETHDNTTLICILTFF
jgi:hypothetical protein